jgi:hypothetical protein
VASQRLVLRRRPLERPDTGQSLYARQPPALAVRLEIGTAIALAAWRLVSIVVATSLEITCCSLERASLGNTSGS